MVKRRVNKRRYGRKLKQKNGDRRHAWKRVGAAVGNFAINRAKHGLRKAATEVFRKKFQDKFRANKPIGGGTSEVSRYTRKLGRRPKKNVYNAFKQLQATLKPIYYRHQGCLPYSSAQGYHLLDRSVVGTLGNAGSSQNLPCYLFGLSNIFANQGSFSSPMAWRLQQQFPVTVSEYAYHWVPIKDQSADGSTVGTVPSWDIEERSTTTANGWPGDKDILSYADIRLICVGATTVATTFEISVVQFKHDWLHPEFIVEELSTRTDIEYEKMARATWEAEVYKYIQSPIMIERPGRTTDAIQVLHKINFTLQPKMTIESNDEGHHKIVKLFKWFNRTQNYNWQNVGVHALPGGGGIQPMSYQVNNVNNEPILQVSATVAPRARMYLMVKATNQTPAVAGATVTPSFDIVMRKKHIYNA